MPKKKSYKKKKKPFSFRRIRSQEGGNIIYWFENQKGDVISFVRGSSQFSDTWDIRVSFENKSFFVPVSKSIAVDLDANEVLQIALKHIRRKF